MLGALQDCFVDFERSCHAARLLLLEGMLNLLQVRAQRGMCTKDACDAVTRAGTTHVPAHSQAYPHTWRILLLLEVRDILSACSFCAGKGAA